MREDSPKVVVVGSLHYDIMVDAPSRPRKGETVTGRRWGPKCGGKGGNQAVAAAGQGVPTRMVGAVGRDSFGPALLANLDRAGVERSGVAVLDGVGSGMSVAIFDDDGDYGAVIVSGANLVIAPEAVADLDVGQDDILILQNEIPEGINLHAAQAARRAGATTILNAAPARLFATDLLEGVDVLVVNAIEAEMLGGGGVTSLETALAAARGLTSLCRAVLVTAGGDGVAFADRAGTTLTCAAIPVVVASTHGAGDAFVGTLAAALVRGQPMRVAIDAANRVAAALVATPEHER